MPDDEALHLVASMVLENGARWGECATPEQWADMEALLSPGSPRRHFWLRARGQSKTTDAGMATIAVMLSGQIGTGDEMYAAAAGKEQAGLLASKIQLVTRNTPELAGAVEVQAYKVLTPSTGAELEVLSSELASSWGKTPLWLFIDEICNHDNTAVKREFVTALMTSLIKRPDSVFLAGSTPSSEGHWSWAIWQRALHGAGKLWRPSTVSGPAPWQDPGELAEEMGNLLEHEWLRLFMCQWASADDTIADESALTDCTREHLSLPPEPGVQYVVAWDIGWKKDHSAVAVAHAGERAGKKSIIIDRLESWVPAKGREVKIGDVLDFAAQMSREYNGAPLHGDQHEAWQAIQDMREQGYDIRAAETTANANSVRAKHLLRLIRDRALEIPPDPVLRREILSLRLAEGTTPGVVRLSSDESAKGHYDRVMAILYAAGELLMRPGWSWKDINGQLRTCLECGKPHLKTQPACVYCQAPNPVALARADPADTRSYSPQPGGWASAYIPEGSRICAAGHAYDGSHGSTCPVCAGSSGGIGSLALPAAFSRALAIGRR